MDAMRAGDYSSACGMVFNVSSMVCATPVRAMTAAWRMAQAMAWPLEEPCALTTAPFTPSSGAPPTSV